MSTRYWGYPSLAFATVSTLFLPGCNQNSATFSPADCTGSVVATVPDSSVQQHIAGECEWIEERMIGFVENLQAVQIANAIDSTTLSGLWAGFDYRARVLSSTSYESFTFSENTFTYRFEESGNQLNIYGCLQEQQNWVLLSVYDIDRTNQRLLLNTRVSNADAYQDISLFDQAGIAQLGFVDSTMVTDYVKVAELTDMDYVLTHGILAKISNDADGYVGSNLNNDAPVQCLYLPAWEYVDIFDDGYVRWEYGGTAQAKEYDLVQSYYHYFRDQGINVVNDPYYPSEVLIEIPHTPLF